MSQSVKKAYVDTTRGQLHYRQCGEGEPLVLLQLLPFGGMMFEPVMPLLAERGYACYAIDLMGYGRSDKRTSEWLVDDFSENLLEAFEQLDITPSTIVGGHFSALIAVDLAVRAEGQVERLVIDGIPIWTAEDRQQRFSKTPPPSLIAEDGSSVQNTWTQTLGMMRRLNPETELTAETENKILDAYVAFVEATYKPGTAKAFFEFQTVEMVAKVNVPTLVIGSPTDTLADHHESAVSKFSNVQDFKFTQTHPLYQLSHGPSKAAALLYTEALHAFITGDPLPQVA